MSLLFDIGANRGDAVVAGLARGFKVVALEAAPKIYTDLENNFKDNPNVRTLKLAVASRDFDTVEFYECIEDGLSTLNRDWLTSDTLPYHGKQFWTVPVKTITIDTLVKVYGVPDLMKIDVEGAEWEVFRGMTKKYGSLTFEWTDVTLDEHIEQLLYLADLGYTEFAPQFIEHHLQEPTRWFSIHFASHLKTIINEDSREWISGGWQRSHLRSTADVGMCWVR